MVYPALVEDAIIDAVAQSTAATWQPTICPGILGMCADGIAAAGYGNGGTVWATENFAVSSNGMGIDEIMAVWSDADHMRPAVEAAYCNMGAGVATANGKIVLHPASCLCFRAGLWQFVLLIRWHFSTGYGSPIPVSQLIMPVKIATPDADGKIYHEVQAGQSFWSIAIAYQITIHDLEVWNNLSRETPLRAGQRLFIPGKDTEGYATPTPVGMVVTQTPDADGQDHPRSAALSGVDYNCGCLSRLGGSDLAIEWTAGGLAPANWAEACDLPGQHHAQPDLERHPETHACRQDGKYYHTVQSGETLSWIAGLYDVPLSDLMTWNGLNNTSVIRPEQKLLLLVTPPVTPTGTYTPSPIALTPSPSPSFTPVPTETLPDAAPQSPSYIQLGSYFRLVYALDRWLALVEIFAQELELACLPYFHFQPSMRDCFGLGLNAKRFDHQPSQ